MQLVDKSMPRMDKENHMAEVRKKIRWATGKRKCGARVWKTRWITIKTSGPGKGPSEKPKA